MAHYQIEQEPLVISKSIMDKLLKEERSGDLIALYLFYYYTAKWQKTNTAKANQSYCMKGLDWGKDRHTLAHNKLEELGLVKRKIKRDELGKAIAHYVHVSFIWGVNAISQLSDNQLAGKPISGEIDSNALSTNNRNALSTDKEKVFSEENTIDTIFEQEPEVNEYLGVPLPEDWSDNSEISSDGSFVPKFTDKFDRPIKQSEITALRNKAKAKAPVREKPVKQTFNYEEELKKLSDSFHKTNKIVALIWFHKKYRFENALQMQAQFDMDKTYGAKLKGYSGEQISKAIELCKQEAEELGYDWKASTVVKKITEIL